MLVAELQIDQILSTLRWGISASDLDVAQPSLEALAALACYLASAISAGHLNNPSLLRAALGDRGYCSPQMSCNGNCYSVNGSFLSNALPGSSYGLFPSLSHLARTSCFHNQLTSPYLYWHCNPSTQPAFTAADLTTFVTMEGKPVS